MRDLIIENGQLISVAVAGLEAVLMLVLLILAIAKKKPAIVLMFLIALGLTFDSAVVAFGSSFSDTLLDILSKCRYVAHGLLLPLTVAICAYVLEWEYSIGMKLSWLLSILLCGAGGAAGWFRETSLSTFAGITRFAPTSSSPEWAEMVGKYMPIAMVALLLISGLIYLIRHKKPFILLGGLCMLGFSLIGPLTGNTDLIFLISMFGEVLLLFFYALHAGTGYKEEGLL